MKGNKVTYLLLGIALIAIGFSVRAYIQLGNHPTVSTDVPPAPSPIIASLQPTQNAPVIPSKSSEPEKNTSPAKTTTQTPAITPLKPTVPTTQTPAVAPIVVYDPISLPYDVDNFSTKKTWRAIIGSVGIKSIEFSKKNYLTVSAGSDTTVGLIELGGSEAWENYTYSLDTNFISGTSFSLIARYKDNKNYVDCTFSEGGSTTIYSIVDGKSNTVVEHNHEIPTIPNVVDIPYAIKVDANSVQCLVNGTTVSATIPSMSPTGGIGVQVYNQVPGTSELDIQKVEVEK